MVADLKTRDAEVLEVSCGEGRILAGLREKGFRVTGTNFGAYPGVPDTLNIHNGVNLLEALPFEDKQFDVVIAMEVIEHIENHRHAIAEMARMVRPGGHLILTFPNVLRVSSRISFLLTGMHKPKRKFIGFDVPVEKSFAFHLYLPELPSLAYLLNAHGLTVEKAIGHHIKIKSLFLYGLLYVPCAVAAAWRFFRKEKHLKRSRQSGPLWRLFMGPAVQCGEKLVVVAVKSDGVDQSDVTPTTRLPGWAKT